ncbi:Oidioi.mRNA.OKI2018_I69.PAR.g10074.t1.cds [Oikopleura dioica]|uniref:Oidioi.mRNA.OKI2018_I69.PAR.g10074.t1.cds n=1 Tax=Oikopleura dioica TaxID=34765 RepID=A0ABN7RSD4_OIKDI|nr:Oidioi.mRNA.OKI2018_I69.PAR.g10074.t1.cds [Oikopleura dioica]
MKILSVLLISSSAQDYDSLAGALGAISLEEFALPDEFVAETDLEEAINKALDALVVEATENEVDAEVRYFGLASATTTTTTPGTNTTTQSPGSGCFKCDAMSMTLCAVSGVFETCEGESSSCFIEAREVNQQLTQLCTGCKNPQACYNLQQSNNSIQYDFAAQKTNLVARGHFDNPISSYSGSEANPIGLGNPTWAVHDETSSINMRMDPSFLDITQWNLYFASSNASPNDCVQRGKDHPKALPFVTMNSDNESVAISPTTTGRDQRHMVYWGVLGAPKSWCKSDLRQIQAEIRSGGASKVMQ